MSWSALVVAAVLMQAAATVSVNPSSGEAGTGMVVVGSGFVPDDRVRVLWDSANLGGTVKVDADGTFTYAAGVPASAAPGAHTIEARGHDTGSVTATFTVLAPTTTTTSTTTTTTAIPATTPTTSTAAKTTTTAALGATTTLTSTTATDLTPAAFAPITTVQTDVSEVTDDASGDRDKAGMGVGGFLALIVTIAAAIGGGTLYMWKRSEAEAPGEHDPIEKAARSTPDPQPTVVPIVEAEGVGEEAGWARHPMVLEPPGHIGGLIGLAGVFLGFGTTTDPDGRGRASVWRSRDGIRWEGIASFETGRADLAIPWRGGLLVLGSVVHDHHRSASCWWSGDGARWEHLTQADDPILAGSAFDGVAVGGGVLVAHGRGLRGAESWVSRDGRIWEQSSLPGTVDLVAAVPGGLLAFGRHVQERRPIVARSLDGIAWKELPPDSVFVFEAIGIASIVSFGGGLVAAGTDKMKGAATVWISENGARWHRTPLEPVPGTSIEHLLVVNDRVVAVGRDFGRRRTGRPGSVAVWESRDSVSWKRLDVAELFATASANGLAAAEDIVLIGGTLVAGHGSPWPEPIAVAWVHDPAQVPNAAEPALASS